MASERVRAVCRSSSDRPSTWTRGRWCDRWPPAWRRWRSSATTWATSRPSMPRRTCGRRGWRWPGSPWSTMKPRPRWQHAPTWWSSGPSARWRFSEELDQAAGPGRLSGGELVGQPVGGGTGQHHVPQAGGPAPPLLGVHAQRPMEGVGGAGHVEGIHPEGRTGQLAPGSGLAGEDEHAVGPVEQRSLLGHQIEPVTHRVDEQDIGDAQRRQRVGPVVLDVQGDGRPGRRAPGLVDPLGGVHDLGPVGEILGQALPRGIRQRHVDHLAPPLGVGHQELLEGQHPPHDVLRGLDAVDPQDDATSPRLGSQVRHGAGALGAGRLGHEALVVRGEGGDERAAAGPPCRPRPPGRGRRSRPGIRPPTAGRETRRPRIRPGPPAARRRHDRAGCAACWGRRRGCGRSARCADRDGPGTASGPATRSGSPAPARSRRRGPGRPRRRRRPGCRSGSPPRPAASAGRTGAGAAGRRGGGGRTTGWCWRRRRRPHGRCRRRPPRGGG